MVAFRMPGLVKEGAVQMLLLLSFTLAGVCKLSDYQKAAAVVLVFGR